MQNRYVLAVVVMIVAVVALVILRLRSGTRGADERASRTARAAGGAPSVGSAPGPGAAAPRAGDAAPPPVRRLTGDERRRLGDDIAAARQRSRAATLRARLELLAPRREQGGYSEDGKIQRCLSGPLDDITDPQTVWFGAAACASTMSVHWKTAGIHNEPALSANDIAGSSDPRS